MLALISQSPLQMECHTMMVYLFIVIHPSKTQPPRLTQTSISPARVAGLMRVGTLVH